MVVLDTDHISLLERGGEISQRLIAKLSALPLEEVAVSIISYEEQSRGWLGYLAKARSMENQIEGYRRLKAQLANYCSLVVLPFDERAAEQFAHLQKHRLRVGTMDLRIAAIALANDALLLTRNSSDFSRVPRLRFEDWSL